jgi:hypothetical protein
MSLHATVGPVWLLRMHRCSCQGKALDRLCKHRSSCLKLKSSSYRFRSHFRPRTTPLPQEKLYSLDLNKIRAGDDKRTTLMVKNIPNKYTQKMLLAVSEGRAAGRFAIAPRAAGRPFSRPFRGATVVWGAAAARRRGGRAGLGRASSSWAGSVQPTPRCGGGCPSWLISESACDRLIKRVEIAFFWCAAALLLLMNALGECV